jgi:hypothetical protein
MVRLAGDEAAEKLLDQYIREPDEGQKKKVAEHLRGVTGKSPGRPDRESWRVVVVSK